MTPSTLRTAAKRACAALCGRGRSVASPPVVNPFEGRPVIWALALSLSRTGSLPARRRNGGRGEGCAQKSRRPVVWLFRREWPLLDCRRILTKNDLIDLIEREAGNLNGGIYQDQLFELEFKSIQIPFALFGQTIDGEGQHTLLIRR
jgi:hypothetical protein